MIRVLRFLFFFLFVRPLVLVVLGMNIRNIERLPKQGPAILVANHNSHLDTLVLMSLFPLQILDKIRPVADAAYFLKTKLFGWFALNIIGILPIRRGDRAAHTEIFKDVHRVLGNGDIVIIFPEGTRGEPEKLSRFKSGISLLAEQNPDVPVVPVFMHGLGQALPKGEFLLVPFFCDVFIGEHLSWSGSKDDFMEQLESRMRSLADEGQFPVWE